MDVKEELKSMAKHCNIKNIKYQIVGGLLAGLSITCIYRAGVFAGAKELIEAAEKVQ